MALRVASAVPLLLPLGALLLAPLVAATPALAQDAPATPPSGGYTQRGVPAEATAEDAVKAREQAYASARRIAYSRMAGELGLPSSLSDSQIEGLVSSTVVEQERSSRTGFSGRVTVNFNPRRVASLGGRVPAGGSVASSGGSSSGSSGNNAAYVPPVSPASSWVEARARFGSLAEWLDLRRRLLASPQVASVQLQAIAVDRARVRLGLRGPADAAPPGLAGAGVLMEPATDGSWRLGLAGGT
ncbi:hypothetical protein [Roseomonas sp. BN140053]|uniref:hypothetical protein n=1 Tax=Roseomonas sp. BN140053 TaxID=3391898 RepID=UPI0039EB5A5E